MFKTRSLVVTAMCIALAAALSFVPALSLPQGGSLTAGRMLFLMLPAYWFGPAVGICGGAAYGLLDFLLGGSMVHPAQLLLDYPLAFGALGLAGFFRGMKYGLPIGYWAGAAGRWLMVTISGGIYFAEYAPAGQHPMLYSALYNLTYIGPEAVITLVLLSVPAFKNVVDHVGKRMMTA